MKPIGKKIANSISKHRGIKVLVKNVKKTNFMGDWYSSFEQVRRQIFQQLPSIIRSDLIQKFSCSSNLAGNRFYL